jgi:RNA polymerase sigma factor (sigma-70 family)
MVTQNSRQLLTECADNGSEAAFSELVSRYVDLVYSTAVRLLNGDTHLAKDVAQLVFADLARKASTLSGEVQLGGWLHRHTCFVVANLKRGERRRQARERKVVEMNSIEDHSEANLEQVRPILDEAINELGAKDRAAILLRYFEQRDFVSVGAALGSSENAAQKRVSRALEELRSLLLRRGVSLSVALLGTMLASGVVSAAPVGLAASISSAALTTAATGVATTSTTSTVLKIMATSKLKVSIISAIAALVIGSGATVTIYEYQSHKGMIYFGGQSWHPWRTAFTVRGNRLISLPKAAPGFKYGGGDSGRGPELWTHIGDAKWKDYRAEFEYCVTGPDSRFNPYGLPSDYHEGQIAFHVADAKESWNEKGKSMYMLAVLGNGDWELHCMCNEYCAVKSGWGDLRSDGARTLLKGKGLNVDRVNGNKFAIEVRGQRIQIWVDGDQIVDVVDDKMGQTFGGMTLDHGGVGFTWGMDAMGWVRNFSVKQL